MKAIKTITRIFPRWLLVIMLIVVANAAVIGVRVVSAYTGEKTCLLYGTHAESDHNYLLEIPSGDIVPLKKNRSLVATYFSTSPDKQFEVREIVNLVQRSSTIYLYRAEERQTPIHWQSILRLPVTSAVLPAANDSHLGNSVIGLEVMWAVDNSQILLRYITDLGAANLSLVSTIQSFALDLATTSYNYASTTGQTRIPGDHKINLPPGWDGTTPILTGSQGNINLDLTAWDARTLQQVRLYKNVDYVDGISWSPDHLKTVTAAASRRITVLSLAAPGSAQTFELPELNAEPLLYTWSHDSRWLQVPSNADFNGRGSYNIIDTASSSTQVIQAVADVIPLRWTVRGQALFLRLSDQAWQVVQYDPATGQEIALSAPQSGIVGLPSKYSGVNVSAQNATLIRANKTVGSQTVTWLNLRNGSVKAVLDNARVIFVDMSVNERFYGILWSPFTSPGDTRQTLTIIDNETGSRTDITDINDLNVYRNGTSLNSGTEKTNLLWSNDSHALIFSSRQTNSAVNAFFRLDLMELLLIPAESDRKLSVIEATSITQLLKRLTPDTVAASMKVFGPHSISGIETIDPALIINNYYVGPLIYTIQMPREDTTAVDLIVLDGDGNTLWQGTTKSGARDTTYILEQMSVGRNPKTGKGGVILRYSVQRRAGIGKTPTYSSFWQATFEDDQLHDLTLPSTAYRLYAVEGGTRWSPDHKYLVVVYDDLAAANGVLSNYMRKIIAVLDKNGLVSQRELIIENPKYAYDLTPLAWTDCHVDPDILP